MQYKVANVKLLSAATTTATGEAHPPVGYVRSFQAHGSTSAGVGAATIVIEVTNAEDTNGDPQHWMTLGTISLTLGTATTMDGFSSNSPYEYVRARISAISGTNATVTVYLAAV